MADRKAGPASGAKTCPECEGSGYGFGLLKSGCATCNAVGKVSGSGPASGAVAKVCPVPRCGGSGGVCSDSGDGVDWSYWVECVGCSLCGPTCDTPAEAIAAWNKLASVEPVPNRYNYEWSVFGPFKQEIGEDLYGIQAHVREPSGLSSEPDSDPGTEPVTGPGPDGRYGTLPLDLAQHIASCHNAMRGLNPEVLGELIAAARTRVRHRASNDDGLNRRLHSALIAFTGRGEVTQ